MMELTTFTEQLLRLSAEDIRICAAGLHAQELTVADEVEQWRAELAVNRLLRGHSTRAEARQANGVAHRTARLVVDVARRRGIELPDGDVTRVARTAAEIARGLSLEPLAGPFVEPIVLRWERAVEAGSPPVVTAA